MRTALLVACALLNLSLTARAEDDGDPSAPPKRERVAFSCDLDYFQATPTKPPKADDPSDFRSYAGSGRLIASWEIVRTGEHQYKISGQIINDNSGSSGSAALFLGNIERSDRLRLIAKAAAASINLDIGILRISIPGTST